MNEEKTPLPVCETGSGKGDQIVLDGFSISNRQSTTKSCNNQSIAAMLLRGSANAIPLKHLQTLTGLEGRTIRRMISRERQAGACICVNNRDGYFLAETETERDVCARSMFVRAREVKRTAEAIAAAEVET